MVCNILTLGKAGWRVCGNSVLFLQLFCNFKIIWKKTPKNSLDPSFSIFLQRKTPWKRRPHTVSTLSPNCSAKTTLGIVTNGTQVGKFMGSCQTSPYVPSQGTWHSWPLPPSWNTWLPRYKTLQIVLLHLWLHSLIPMSQCWNSLDFSPGLLFSPAHYLPR